MKLNRWPVLFASVALIFCIGFCDTWSVFQKPLMTYLHASTAQVSWTFSLSFSVGRPLILLANWLQDRLRSKLVIFACVFLFGAGVFLTGYAHSLQHLYWSYGFLAGMGGLAGYTCIVANAVKWFPDRRGLASGIAVAGICCGALVIAPLAASLILSRGVLAAFRILGLSFLIVIAVLIKIIRVPPVGYGPDVWNSTAPLPDTGAVSDRDWRQMLADPMFYLLWLIFGLGTLPGLMIIAHAAPIGQELVKLSPKAAAVAVSCLSVSNAAGRLLWGGISDKTSRFSTFVALFTVLAATMFLFKHVAGFGSFILALMLVGSCHGGFMSTVPASVADVFGPKYLSANFVAVLSSFCLAAVLGPHLLALTTESHHGDYAPAFSLAGFVALGGILVSIVALWEERRTCPRTANLKLETQ
jgi:MFS transporter, OFA family, oxalate/formate antiporter